jgi:hypothetical protein
MAMEKTGKRTESKGDALRPDRIADEHAKNAALKTRQNKEAGLKGKKGGARNA